MAKVLKTCPKRFIHAGSTFELGKMTDAELERLAKDPTFKHIIPEEKKQESETATTKKASAKKD